MFDAALVLRLPDLPDSIARPARRGEDGQGSLRRWVLGAVLLAHALGVIVIDQAMELRERALTRVAPEDSSVVEIRFLEPPVVEAARDTSTPQPVDAVARPVRRPRPVITDSTVDEPGVEARFLPAEPPPALESRRLFDPNGRVRLPERLAGHDPSPARDLLAPPRRVLPHEPTRFERAWVPDGENLGQLAVRKVPLLGLLLQGVNGDPCPANSIDPDCEAVVQAQRAYIPPTPQSAKQPW